MFKICFSFLSLSTLSNAYCYIIARQNDVAFNSTVKIHRFEPRNQTSTFIVVFQINNARKIIYIQNSLNDR